MTKRLKLRYAYVLVLLCALAASVFVGSLLAGGFPKFTFRSQCLVGNELRVLLETANTYRRFDSSSLKTSTAKGWLITVDLSKKGPIAGRARVFGPLWDVPNERSSLSFDAGAHFTKADVAAARATPFIDFDADGTVVRIGADPKRGGGGMIREHLVMVANPYWTLDGPFLPLPPAGRPMNEETVVTLSRRYHLQFAAGQTTLHERLTGKRIPDPWVEAAFAAEQAIPTFENVRTWLTDDLKYLVASPEAIWNDNGVIHETFQIGGKTYGRGEYGLVWERPRPDPIVFKKDHKEGVGSVNSIVGAFSIQGRLYFYYSEGALGWLGGGVPKEDAIARLVPFSGGPAYQAKPPADRRVEWGFVPPQHMQLLEKKPDRIVFFGANDLMSPNARHRVHDEAVVVFVWDLQKGTLSTYDEPTGELFSRRFSEYVPKRVTKVP